MHKTSKNKTAKGLLSLFAVILLMCSILAGSYFYDRSVTSYTVKENKKLSKNQITREVSGLEKVSWF